MTQSPASTMGAEGSNDALRLTVAELVFLCALVDGDHRTENLQLLAIDSVMDEQILHSAGASSLFARGLAELDGEDMAFPPALAAVTHALCHADRRIEVGLAAAGIDDALILLADGEVTLVITPRALGVFELSFAATTTLPDLLQVLADRFLAESGERLVILRRSTSDDPAALAVLVTEDRHWLSTAQVPPIGATEEIAREAFTATDRAGVLAQLATLGAVGSGTDR